MNLLEPLTVPEHQRADTNAERQRRYRERNRAAQRRFYEAHKPLQAKHRLPPDDIGPAIREGEAIADNLDRCDAKWAKLLGSQRYVDARSGGWSSVFISRRSSPGSDLRRGRLGVNHFLLSCLRCERFGSPAGCTFEISNFTVSGILKCTDFRKR